MAYNLIKTGAAALLGIVIASTAARADFCNNTVTDKVNQVMAEQYGNKTAEIRNALSALEAAGQTNTQVYAQLQNLLDTVYNRFVEQGNAAAAQGIQDCRDGLQPIQDIMDSTVAYFTGGLSLVLPERMTHIDMGEILSGNILGGEHSIFRDLGIKW